MAVGSTRKLISGGFTLVQSCYLCPHFWPITVFEEIFDVLKTASTLVSLQDYRVDESGEAQPQS